MARPVIPDAAVVRARIAGALVGCSPAALLSANHPTTAARGTTRPEADDESSSMRIGAFTLRASQVRAVHAIERAFTTYGGALLADPPGTGKTVIGLAVAHRLADALVVAPAALRAQWADAAKRAEVRVRFVSCEALSQGAAVSPAPLVIVDEAHHVRSPGTKRYARLAELVIGSRVLLLSATPVVNTPRDRDALLALFLGERASALSAQDAGRVIIRRESEHVPRPLVKPLEPLPIADEHAWIAEALQELSPPFPAADGTAALAILRLSLAMSWASSLAALDAALRRRIQRGAALADSLAAGRWPERSALRQWVLGDDATQLAMPLLLPNADHVPPDAAHATLARHLEDVTRLRKRLGAFVREDADTRAEAIRTLARTYADVRLVVFAQHAETVKALFAALRGEPGVVAITGERVRAAAGRWSREEVLAALGPRAGELRGDDPRAIRILLTTDLLAEGIELQGVRLVVHGDAVWTPARLEQRVGRAARIGGGAEVMVTHFAIPIAAHAMLRLPARHHDKLAASADAFTAPRAVEQSDARLADWRAARFAQSRIPPTRMAAVRAERSGFLAALRIGDEVQMVAGLRTATGWRVTDDPNVLLALIDDSEGAPLRLNVALAKRVRRAIARWCRRRLLVTTAGIRPTLEPALRRRLQRRIAAAVHHAPLALRPSFAGRAAAALAVVVRSASAGMARALSALERQRASHSEFVVGLEQLADSAREQRRAEEAPPRARLIAALILQADETRERR